MHASRAAGSGSSSAIAELQAAAAAREREIILKAAIKKEEERLRVLVSETDAAWAAEGLAREQADQAMLAAAESDAAYRRERFVNSKLSFGSFLS